jgi:hypothetical protein
MRLDNDVFVVCNRLQENGIAPRLLLAVLQDNAEPWQKSNRNCGGRRKEDLQ